MKNRLINRALCFLVLMLSVSFAAAAQERGQYLPGFRGLNVAEQPGEGFTVGNIFTYYPANSIRDRNGDEFPIDADLDIVADTTLLAYTTKKKIFGATYSASVYIPFLNTAVTTPRLDDSIKRRRDRRHLRGADKPWLGVQERESESRIRLYNSHGRRCDDLRLLGTSAYRGRHL